MPSRGSFCLFCSVLMVLAFVSSYFIIFVIKYLVTLCLLMRDRRGWTQMGGRWERTGRGRGRETHNQGILCEKKKIHSQQKGGKEIGRQQTVACGEFNLEGSQEEGCGI